MYRILVERECKLAFKIEIEHIILLQHLWDKAFNSSKLEILCYTKIKRLDDLNYFRYLVGKCCNFTTS